MLTVILVAWAASIAVVLLFALPLLAAARRGDDRTDAQRAEQTPSGDAAQPEVAAAA